MRLAVVAAVVAACSAPERASPRRVTGALVAPGLRLPDTATPLGYAVRLDIDPESEIFRGEVRIEVRLEQPTDHVWLHVDQLAITAARWDGGTLEPADVSGQQMRAFRFGRVVEPTTLTLELEYTGRTTGDQEGLFRQRDGAWYVFSQGEAVFARRIVPCFDEPRFKTPWRVTLVVPKRQTALSNMPAETTTVLRDNKLEVVFAPTPPMPSYLLAVAVGPFELVDAGTVGRARVPVRVAVRAGLGKRAAVAAARLPAVVDAIERYLDDALPVAKLDLVGVPNFFGAMENPGLITFHEPILVGDPSRKAFANYFTFIAAHEIAHQWFGNLVTPAWWDHLWLSEAFASWLGDKIMRELDAYDDAPLRFALARREALDADRSGQAKPLSRHVRTNAEADAGFDSIAYAKGQLVLATFEAFVGEQAFRELVRGYVRATRGRVVTTADLTARARAMLGAPIATALAPYVGTVGTPAVELALRCDAKPTVVARNLAAPVPLCLGYGTTQASTRTCALVDGTTELRVGDTCPAVVHANPDGGYYHTWWTSHGPRGPAPRVADLAPAARIIAGDDLAAAVHRGTLSAQDVIGELRLLTESRDVYAQLGAIALARALDTLVDDATRPAWTTWLAARFADRLGADKKRPGAAESEVVQALIGLVPADAFAPAVTRRAHSLLDRSLPDIYSELPAGLVTLAAVHGGDKLFDRLVARARLLRDAEVRVAWLGELGELGLTQLPRALRLVLEGQLQPDEAWAAMARYFAHAATRTAAWRAVQPVVAALVARLGGDHAGAVIDAAAHLCDKTRRDEVAAAFEPHVAAIASGRAQLTAALAAIDACMARRAKLGDLAAALAASR